MLINYFCHQLFQIVIYFFGWNLQPPSPSSPKKCRLLFPSNPPLKVKVLSSLPFWKLSWGFNSTLPPAETGGACYEVVPQVSVSVPIFFNIYLNDLFYFLRCDVCNSLMIQHLILSLKNLYFVLNKLEEHSVIAIEWFENNYMKLNSGNCQLLCRETNFYVK